MEQEPAVHVSKCGHIADLFKRVMRHTRLSLRTTVGCLSYLRLFLRVLRELIVLDDLSLVLRGPVAHPDPAEVLRALRKWIDDGGMMILVQKTFVSMFFQVTHSTYQVFPPQVLSAHNYGFHN